MNRKLFFTFEKLIRACRENVLKENIADSTDNYNLQNSLKKSLKLFDNDINKKDLDNLKQFFKNENTPSYDSNNHQIFLSNPSEIRNLKTKNKEVVLSEFQYETEGNDANVNANNFNHEGAINKSPLDIKGQITSNTTRDFTPIKIECESFENLE